MNDTFQKSYSECYDFLYQNKDYVKESQFILNLFDKYSIQVNNILDLGCGTAGHIVPLIKKGLKVTGIDQSQYMLDRAKEKLYSNNIEADLIHQDISSFEVAEQFDAVISCFAVLCYITQTNDLLKLFSRVLSNLKKDGVFIFDVWHGHGVLETKPDQAYRHMVKGHREIIRLSKCCLNEQDNIVDTYFTCIDIHHGQVKQRFEEKHQIRYFFPREIKELLLQTGFRSVEFCPFLRLHDKLSAKDFYMTVIAKP